MSKIPRRRPLPSDDLSINALIVDWELFPGRLSKYIETIRRGTNLNHTEPQKLLELFFAKAGFVRKDTFYKKDEFTDPRNIEIKAQCSKFEILRKKNMTKMILTTVGELGLNLEFMEKNLEEAQQAEVVSQMKNHFRDHEYAEMAHIQYSRWVIRAICRDIQKPALSDLLKASEANTSKNGSMQFIAEVEAAAVECLSEFVSQHRNSELPLPVWPNSFLKYRGCELVKQVSSELGEYLFCLGKNVQALKMFQGSLPCTPFDEEMGEPMQLEHAKFPFVTIDRPRICGYIRACESLLNLPVEKDRPPHFELSGGLFDSIESARAQNLLDKQNASALVDLLILDNQENDLHHGYRANLYNSLVKQFKTESYLKVKNGSEPGEVTLLQKVKLCNAIKQIFFDTSPDLPLGKSEEIFRLSNKTEIDENLLNAFLTLCKLSLAPFLESELPDDQDIFRARSLRLQAFLRRLYGERDAIREILATFESSIFEKSEKVENSSIDLFSQFQTWNLDHTHFHSKESPSPDDLFTYLWHTTETKKFKLLVYQYYDLLKQVDPGLPRFMISNFPDKIYVHFKENMRKTLKCSEKDFFLLNIAFLKAQWSCKMHYFDVALQYFDEFCSVAESETLFISTKLKMFAHWGLYLCSLKKWSKVKKILHTYLEYSRGQQRTFFRKGEKLLENLLCCYLNVKGYQDLFELNVFKGNIAFDEELMFTLGFVRSFVDLLQSDMSLLSKEDISTVNYIFSKLAQKPLNPDDLDICPSIESLLSKLYCKEILELVTCLLANILQYSSDQDEDSTKIVYNKRHGQIGSFVDLMNGKTVSYSGLDVSFIEKLLHATLSRAAKLYPSHYSFALSFGDLLYRQGSYRLAFTEYLGVGMRNSRMFEKINLLSQVWDQLIIERMVDCLMHMKAFIEAAVFAQLLNEKEKTIRFKSIHQACTQDQISGIPLKEEYYPYFWDKQSLEVLISIHRTQGDTKREALAMSVFQNGESSWMNDRQHQAASVLLNQSQFFRSLTRQFMS